MVIVDRIINDIAICESDGALLEIPLTAISGGVREVDILCSYEH